MLATGESDASACCARAAGRAVIRRPVRGPDPTMTVAENKALGKMRCWPRGIRRETHPSPLARSRDARGVRTASPPRHGPERAARPGLAAHPVASGPPPRRPRPGRPHDRKQRVTTKTQRNRAERTSGQLDNLLCAYYENTPGGGLGWCGVDPQDHFHPSRCGRPPAAGLTLWWFFVSIIHPKHGFLLVRGISHPMVRSAASIGSAGAGHPTGLAVHGEAGNYRPVGRAEGEADPAVGPRGHLDHLPGAVAVP